MTPDLADRVTQVDLLRHGSCSGGEIYRGTTDTPLDDSGWAQMNKALESIGGWQSIVSSPLSRCRKFAEHYAAAARIPMQVSPQLREVYFGDWEGRLLEDVWQEDPELVSRFYADPGNVTPPRGESMLVAQQRVCTAWDELMDQKQGESILVISHGGVIRLLLSYLLDIPLKNVARLDICYASMTRLRIYHSRDGDFPLLQSLNAPGNSA